VLDMGILSSSVEFSLRMASVAAGQRFYEAMRAFRLRPGQFATLVLIGANPGVGQRGISETLRIDKANFTGLLNTLERRKLVERRADPGDHRRYALYLTREGQALLRKASRAYDRLEAGLAKLLPARVRKDFVANLRLIAE